jgi:hypothetical protein
VIACFVHKIIDLTVMFTSFLDRFTGKTSGENEEENKVKSTSIFSFGNGSKIEPLERTTNSVRFPCHSVDVNTSNTFKSWENRSLDEAWLSFGPTPSKKIHYMTPLPNDIPVFQVFTKHNTFAEAVHIAFFHHYPLRISPDTLWITILQGLAIHINEHSEEFRDKFVSYGEGKKTLVVGCDDVPVTKEEWSSVISQFSTKIQENTHTAFHPLINCSFSTTTEIEQTIMQISIMDTMKNYFTYAMVCGCGIPWIELMGTVDDWKLLYQKIEEIRSLGIDLDWWINPLLEVMNHFVAASQGEIGDGKFWRSVVYKLGGSGMIGDPITGWLQVFFPYVQGENGTYYKSSQLDSWKTDAKCLTNPDEDKPRGFGGPIRPLAVSLKNIPGGISSAPVHLTDIKRNEKKNMIFAGGLTAVVFGKDGALEAATGYAILEK